MLARVREAFSGGSVRIRLLQAFSVLLVFLAVVSTLSLERFGQLTSRVHELVDNQSKRVLLAQKANQQSQSAALHLLRLLHTPTRDQRIPLYLGMDAALADADAAINSLTEISPSELTQDVLRLRGRYGLLFQQTVELIEIEGLEPAFQHFERNTDPVLRDLLDAIMLLSERQQDRMEAEVSRLEALALDTRQLIFLILLGALLMGTLLAALVAKSLSQPLQKAVNLAVSIAEGDYEQPVPRSELIEIRTLLKSLEAMRDRILQREQRIRRQAYSDALTGLPNRTDFMETLDAAVEHKQGTLVLMDLNRFGQINSALGHVVGDQLLQSVGSRLARHIQPPHKLARLDSDEFALILSDISGEAALQEVLSIIQHLREPIVLQGQRLDIDVSTGVAFFPEDGDSPQVLLKRVDLALKLAKRQHTSYALAANVQLPKQHEHLSLLGEMQAALDQDEFLLHYQPKQNAQTGQVTGVEALVRWQHPEKGMVPPGTFIPFAEQTGFVRNITPWVIKRALADQLVWLGQGIDLVVSINISAQDLISEELVSQVQAQLEAHQLPASRVCLEITESALMDDPEKALRYLGKLSSLGVKLSIDDYGAGQASLAYVRDLPVNELKIDQSFVSHLDQSPRNAAIVWSTILLCRELGLQVVAEGVESEAEASWLRRHQCDLLQGFGIARPMPAEALIEWLGNQVEKTAQS